MNTPKDSSGRSSNDALSLPALQGGVSRAKAMKSMLDETNEDDYFGTEGWKRHFGWED